MSEHKVDSEITVKSFRNHASFIDDDDIIDVSAFDFDDADAWLYIPADCCTKSSIYEMYAWLKSEPELNPSVNRKCIDTRTFTRPKKRSNRVSFESILETSTPQSTNVWKNQCSSFSNTDEDDSRFPRGLTDNSEHVVPHMLKIPPMAVANLLADETINVSGQESMEVFLNMSHSKGVDSFINLTDPGLSDPLMSVSQPSILYSSIISLPREDAVHNLDYAEDSYSENWSQSIDGRMKRLEQMGASDNLNQTFAKGDNSVLDNKSYSLSPLKSTFTNQSETFENPNLNGTYCANTPFNKFILGSNRNQTITTNLPSTCVTQDIRNIKLQSNEKVGLLPPDATYLSQETENKGSLDSTYLCKETLRNTKDVILTTGIDMRDKRGNTNRNIPVNIPETSSAGNSTVSSGCDNVFHSTFKLPFPLGNQSTPKNTDVLLNSTFKTFKKHLGQPRMPNTALCSTFKAPNSLRRELLMEIQRSEDRRTNSTYNHADGENERERKESIKLGLDRHNVFPVENKYNTYQKESSGDCTRNKTEQKDDVGTCSHKEFQHNKYYTFTKKTDGTQSRNVDIDNAESIENVDSALFKPFSKLQKKKQHIPRMLSKLPQFLQKSNPNLVTNSLKTLSITGCGNNVSNVGFMKGSQPNIVGDVEKSLKNKLYSLGKMKSGSEQHLLELSSSAADFQIIGTSGSTESIESTQSAHSAPDLDDRLSTCSDSSHNSYTVHTMNIEQLHQIVRMQEESLRQDSTSKPGRRVLENTWITANEDLPSPILKSSIDDCKANSNSLLPSSTDCTMKSSTPTLSPSGSSQSLNTDGHPSGNILKQQNEVTVTKQVEISNKPGAKQENKTKLRQPTNWNTGAKAIHITSAIPRPPSRIPGPRFSRPVTKNNQDDVRRGYI